MSQMQLIVDFVRGNTVYKEERNVVFFGAGAKEGADAEELRKLVAGSIEGAYCTLDILDGKEHNYIELGGWMGDQGTALQLMGMGADLGLWTLLTPRTVLGDAVAEEMVKQLAGQGMVAIVAVPS